MSYPFFSLGFLHHMELFDTQVNGTGFMPDVSTLGTGTRDPLPLQWLGIYMGIGLRALPIGPKVVT